MNAETQAPNSQGQWLKLIDAAQVLGVSEITLRRKVKNGKIPHSFRDGKYFVFLPKDASQAAPSPTLPVTHSASNSYAAHPMAPQKTQTTQASQQALSMPLASVSQTEIWIQEKYLLEQKVELLKATVEQRDATIRNLRRELEDQQTLIAFLEHTLQNGSHNQNR